jgi:Ca2+-binding EF-hand superfamily protein
MLQDLTDEEEILRRAFQFFDKVDRSFCDVLHLPAACTMSHHPATQPAPMVMTCLQDGNGEISVTELRTTMHELGDLLTEEEIMNFMQVSCPST